jgi:hypothetical protein
MEKAQKVAEKMAQVPPGQERQHQMYMACLEEVGTRTLLYGAAGAAMSLILFRSGGHGRGVFTGLATGYGIGGAMEQCNLRYTALESIIKAKLGDKPSKPAS